MEERMKEDEAQENLETKCWKLRFSGGRGWEGAVGSCPSSGNICPEASATNSYCYVKMNIKRASSHRNNRTDKLGERKKLY